MELISLNYARENGLKRYFTGEPCKSGHISERYVYNNRCLNCDVAYKAKYYKSNIEKIKRDTRAWAKSNPEKTKKYGKAWKQRNQDQVKAYNTKYYELNRERHTEYVRRWRELNSERHELTWKTHRSGNRHLYNAIEARRRAAKLQRTPPWADFDEIKKIYEECTRLTKETNIEHHVDHIVPLQGKLVSGLHVHWNLQVIPAKDNLSKQNKFNIE